jgi:PAS domain S-box-containing protein
MYERGVFILLTQAAKAFFVSIFSLLVFHAIVTRHMIEIAKRLKSFDPDVDNQPFRLNRTMAKNTDELDQIVLSFNSMTEMLKLRQETLNAAHLKMIEDKDARMKAESDRREANIIARNYIDSANKINNIIESVPMPIIIFNKYNKKVEFYNKSAIDVFEQDQAYQINIFEMFHRSDAIDELIAIIDREGRANQVELVAVGRDGKRFWTLVWASTLQMVNSHAVMLIISDISQRKRWEEQVAAARDKAEAALQALRSAQDDLVRAEKLASLGGMVAGVAHEVNTPIGSALTGITYLKEMTGEIIQLFNKSNLKKSNLIDYLSSAEESCGLVEDNLHRAAELIQSFKQAAVDQISEERRSFALADNIRDAFNGLQHQIRRAGHKVEIECPEDVVINGYPGALFQALTNLIANSLTHAYAEGGQGLIRVSVAADERSVFITFADDGKGVAQEHQERLFEPFFTTRRGAGGSGLGLHIVYNIVNQKLRGDIRFIKECEAGAAFLIHLPKEM